MKIEMEALSWRLVLSVLQNGLELSKQFKRSWLSNERAGSFRTSTTCCTKEGIETYETISQMVASFTGKRVIWLMLPAGEITESVLKDLLPLVLPEDIVIEGGNSNYKDSIRRGKQFADKEVAYLDCGTSGGISGARKNACLMVGGDLNAFHSIEQVFKDVAIEGGYLYAGASGSGHFLKMIHNGIEYGMMQAIGEGFQLIEQSEYAFDLAAVAHVWNHGSVIRSWLMEIAEAQFFQQPPL